MRETAFDIREGSFLLLPSVVERWRLNTQGPEVYISLPPVMHFIIQRIGNVYNYREVKLSE